MPIFSYGRKQLEARHADDYPGERFIACRNPELAVARRRKREHLLLATARDLAAIKQAVARARKPLRGSDRIALSVGETQDGQAQLAHHHGYRLQLRIDAEGLRQGGEFLARRFAAQSLTPRRTMR